MIIRNYWEFVSLISHNECDVIIIGFPILLSSSSLTHGYSEFLLLDFMHDYDFIIDFPELLGVRHHLFLAITKSLLLLSSFRSRNTY